jgi:UDP-sugar transporter A1/2/3
LVHLVFQNNLQYVAASNLEAATFQVTYQMKVLTTAGFSVLLLRKILSPSQWLSLLFLAIGVGIVQIQTIVHSDGSSSGDMSAVHPTMNAMKGFMAVVAACFTSGLAGVYFEMVLKNSQTDLWVRNVQLSLFSLLPALAPVIFNQGTRPGQNLLSILFDNFGGWAWTTVFVQVLGGLVTAMVIKYSGNILKGFATSLSIVLSFLASVSLFDFQISITFILGSTIVLIATCLYNQHPTRINMAINKETWVWLKSENLKDPNPSRPPRKQQFGNLSAISSQSSLSSMTSSSGATPLFSDSEARTFIRQ